MSDVKNKIMAAIAAMYVDQIPMMRFFEMPANFKIPMAQLRIMLMPGNPATPEDSDKMMENSTTYIDMLMAIGVLAIVRPEKAPEAHPGAALAEPVTLVMPGKEYDMFVKEAKDYVDTDAIIIRTLGVSRQDFDVIANEYKEIVEKITCIDDILVAWKDLSLETKCGIIRGILVQRSIMAQVLISMKARTVPLLKHEQETIKWIDGLLGPIEPLEEPQ